MCNGCKNQPTKCQWPVKEEWKLRQATACAPCAKAKIKCSGGLGDLHAPWGRWMQSHTDAMERQTEKARETVEMMTEMRRKATRRLEEATKRLEDATQMLEEKTQRLTDTTKRMEAPKAPSRKGLLERCTPRKLISKQRREEGHERERESTTRQDRYKGTQSSSIRSTSRKV